MRRPKTLKAARDRCWKAISEWVRRSWADDNGYVKCVTCDKVAHWKEMHCGHYQHGLTYGQNEEEFFVWEENLSPQCPGCNTYRGGMLDRYTMHIIDYYGRGTVDELMDEKMAQKGKPLKMYLDNYWELEQQYKALIDGFEA